MDKLKLYEVGYTMPYEADCNVKLFRSLSKAEEYKKKDYPQRQGYSVFLRAVYTED